MLLSGRNHDRVEVKHHKKKHKNGHIRCEEEYGDENNQRSTFITVNCTGSSIYHIVDMDVTEALAEMRV
jgi:hypothetical protein